MKVFEHLPNNVRKVIFATNLAETSITIKGIVYVVDCGFVKLRFFNTQTGTDALVVVPISQASAKQRAGRAGRTLPDEDVDPWASEILEFKKEDFENKKLIKYYNAICQKLMQKIFSNKALRKLVSSTLKLKKFKKLSRLNMILTIEVD
ncbi:hypothetical protein RND71_043362 [Anisodus tanguticus]|uniref:RNA helicase n=1 Tax=Anisodus tanguticus TaxID=243964 RepID=A0AAE1QQ07_9SOLA|nr:hypothetical protein RND71_043362 [Anisodus tanguticus]